MALIYHKICHTTNTFSDFSNDSTGELVNFLACIESIAGILAETGIHFKWRNRYLLFFISGSFFCNYHHLDVCNLPAQVEKSWGKN